MQQRLVKDESLREKPQPNFTDQAVIDALSAPEALKKFLDLQGATPAGGIEKVGSMVVVNARKGERLFVIQVLPEP